MDGFAKIRELIAHARNIFRMAEIKEPGVIEQIINASDDLPLQIVVEIDNHVTQENRVEWPAHGPLVQKIERVESNHRANRVVEDVYRLLSIDRSQPTVSQCRPDRFNIRTRIPSTSAARDHVGIKVRGQNLDVVALEVGYVICDSQSDRKGLLTRRAASRPNSDPSATDSCAFERSRKHLASEMLKMMILTNALTGRPKHRGISPSPKLAPGDTTIIPIRQSSEKL